MIKKWALNPSNLAIIGVLDEFYDLYCSIHTIYEHHQKLFLEENGTNRPLWGKYWDELCIKDVRSAFAPVLQSHISLFSEDVERAHAAAYAFQSFTFIKGSHKTGMITGEDTLSAMLQSFTEFLFEFQLVVCNLHFRWKNNIDPSFTFAEAWKEINTRIEQQAKEKKTERQFSVDEEEETTGYILYLFDNLSATQCYKKDHPVVPAKFIACLASGTGRIVLPVHYCNKCKKYFIGKRTLVLFESTYGKLLLEKRTLDKEENSFENFRIESKLHQLGYNVVEGNMTSQERRDLLIHLIEHKLISYFDLCSTIENNIRFFQGSDRHQLAVQKWKEDLKAIGDYIKGIKRASSIK